MLVLVYLCVLTLFNVFKHFFVGVSPSWNKMPKSIAAANCLQCFVPNLVCFCSQQCVIFFIHLSFRSTLLTPLWLVHCSSLSFLNQWLYFAFVAVHCWCDILSHIFCYKDAIATTFCTAIQVLSVVVLCKFLLSICHERPLFFLFVPEPHRGYGSITNKQEINKKKWNVSLFWQSSNTRTMFVQQLNFTTHPCQGLADRRK